MLFLEMRAAYSISPVAFLAASLQHWGNALPIKQCVTNTLNGYIRGRPFLTDFFGSWRQGCWI